MKRKYAVALIVVFLIPVLFYTKKTEEGDQNIPLSQKLDKIFGKEDFSVLNFGDIMFDRGVRNIIENRNRDPFEHIKKSNSFFHDYDVVVANLEGPIVTMDRSLCQTKAYNFQFASDTTNRIREAGITMVNIANNHSYDCYAKGYESTISELSKAGIDYIGQRPQEKSYVEKNINGKKVAFIGIDETVAPIPVSGYYQTIKELKSKNDFVIVNIHWGTEYMLTENDSQTAIAQALIDSGADAIFGHHPHVIEPVKIYKGKPIFYSLGNFVFDQNFGDTTKGLGAGVVFEKNKISVEIYPFNIKIFAPDFMTGQEREEFCNKFLRNLDHDGCKFEIN